MKVENTLSWLYIGASNFHVREQEAINTAKNLRDCHSFLKVYNSYRYPFHTLSPDGKLTLIRLLLLSLFSCIMYLDKDMIDLPLPD